MPVRKDPDATGATTPDETDALGSRVTDITDVTGVTDVTTETGVTAETGVTTGTGVTTETGVTSETFTEFTLESSSPDSSRMAVMMSAFMSDCGIGISDLKFSQSILKLTDLAVDSSLNRQASKLVALTSCRPRHTP